MTADQQTLLMFKELIALLPEDSQVKVKEAAQSFAASLLITQAARRWWHSA